MAWAKIDDQLHGHPKVNRAFQECPAALGLHLLAMSYTACYGRDGVVDESFVRQKLIKSALRKKAVSVLVSCGLWDELDPGEWRIHDWSDYNLDAATIEERRQAKAEAGRLGGLAKAANAGKPLADAKQPPSSRLADAQQPGLPPSPSPSPTSEVSDVERARPVKFNGRAVPRDRVTVATKILEDFNDREGTSYQPFTGSGKPSEPFKRVLGAIIDRPHIGVELGVRINEVCLAADRFWEGPAQPGNVWGPGVVDRNVAKAMGARGGVDAQSEAVRLKLLQGPKDSDKLREALKREGVA
jgi:hypothetical protein